MAIALDEDHAVLVGAQAGEDVLLAHRAAQQRADLHQHLVGHVEAGAVVEVAKAVDVDEGDGQRAVVALGARDLLGQALAEGAVVGQAGEHVRRRLGVHPGAMLGVGHGGGDEVGVVLQALLGSGGELVRIAGHDDERAPHRGAVAHRGGETHAAVLAVHAVARDGLAAAQAVEQAARAHVHCRAGVLGAVLVLAPAAEDGDAVGVLEADDGGTVGAQQVPGVERDEREDACGRRTGGDRGRHAPQRGLLLGHAALGGLELARPAGGAGQQLAPGHDDAADQEVDGHDDDELAREVVVQGMAVVDEGQRVDGPAGQPVGDGLARRVEERGVDHDQPQVVERRRVGAPGGAGERGHDREGQDGGDVRQAHRRVRPRNPGQHQGAPDHREGGGQRRWPTAHGSSCPEGPA